MKFFAVFAVLVAVAAADFSSWTLPQLSDALQNPETDPAIVPALEQALNNLMDGLFAEKPVVPVDVAAPVDLTGWTLYELSMALQDPTTDPALIPHLEQALNQMMDAIHAGIPVVPVDVAAPVDLTGWTLYDLSMALQDPTTDPALIPHLEQALNQMMDAIHAGIPVEAVGVPVKPMEVSYWTVEELSEALQNPATDPALLPYLEHALNEMMDALFAGNQVESIAVAAPAGLVPAKPEPVEIPSPVVVAPSPVEVAPSPVVVAPSPVTPPASPLVQIIVNIQSQA